MPQLILASTSPFRRRLLADAGLRARGVAPGVTEEAGGIDDPVQLVRTLAVRKARAVADRFPAAWVLGADQMAYDLQERIPIGKPRDPEHHFRMLAAFRGRAHALVTGFALLGPDLHHVGHEETLMHVREDLEDAELRSYVASGEASGCAAGYALEGRGAFLFRRVEGDYFNVLGLPLLAVVGVLRSHGWRFDSHE